MMPALLHQPPHPPNSHLAPKGNDSSAHFQPIELVRVDSSESPALKDPRCDDASAGCGRRRMRLYAHASNRTTAVGARSARYRDAAVCWGNSCDRMSHVQKYRQVVQVRSPQCDSLDGAWSMAMKAKV